MTESFKCSICSCTIQEFTFQKFKGHCAQCVKDPKEAKRRVEILNFSKQLGDLTEENLLFQFKKLILKSFEFALSKYGNKLQGIFLHGDQSFNEDLQFFIITNKTIKRFYVYEKWDEYSEYNDKFRILSIEWDGFSDYFKNFEEINKNSDFHLHSSCISIFRDINLDERFNSLLKIAYAYAEEPDESKEYLKQSNSIEVYEKFMPLVDFSETFE